MLKEINPRAGAVDVGSETFHAAVYGGEVKVFATFTRDLSAVLEFFKKAGVQTVAMEATGVYWMPLYEALQKGAIKVCMVNGARTQDRCRGLPVASRIARPWFAGGRFCARGNSLAAKRLPAAEARSY